MQDAPRWGAIHTILAPTDLSAASLPGVLQTAELAQRLRARLILMTAIPRPRAPVAYGRCLDQVADTARMQLASVVRATNPAGGRRGVAVRFVALVGAPADAILEVAGTEAVDLVVMATRGRSGLSRLLHGSVAEEVVRASPSPVLMIRADGTPARTAAAA